MINDKLNLLKTSVQRAYMDNIKRVSTLAHNIYKTDFNDAKHNWPSKIGQSSLDSSVYSSKKNRNRNCIYSDWVYIYLVLPNKRAIFVETVVYAEIVNSKTWTQSELKKYINKRTHRSNNVPYIASMALPAIKKANQVIYDLVGADNSFNEMYIPDLMSNFEKHIKHNINA